MTKLKDGEGSTGGFDIGWMCSYLDPDHHALRLHRAQHLPVAVQPDLPVDAAWIKICIPIPNRSGGHMRPDPHRREAATCRRSPSAGRCCPCRTRTDGSPVPTRRPRSPDDRVDPAHRARRAADAPAFGAGLERDACTSRTTLTTRARMQDAIAAASEPLRAAHHRSTASMSMPARDPRELLVTIAYRCALTGDAGQIQARVPRGSRLMPIRPPALDDRSFDDLVADLVRRIPAHTPEWTNPREGDPGRTLIDLFAWLGDTILYRANLIPERQRLAFLRLLGAGDAPRRAGARPRAGVDRRRSAPRAAPADAASRRDRQARAVRDAERDHRACRSRAAATSSASRRSRGDGRSSTCCPTCGSLRRRRQPAAMSRRRVFVDGAASPGRDVSPTAATTACGSRCSRGKPGCAAIAACAKSSAADQQPTARAQRRRRARARHPAPFERHRHPRAPIPHVWEICDRAAAAAATTICRSTCSPTARRA